MRSHERSIQYALSLARKGYQNVFPNPPVGSLVVKDRKVIATGFHGEDGIHHAEVVALNKAGNDAKGSTLYVTLEPCNHRGKTPPCVDKIIESGVSKVIFGTPDPNKLASGGGDQLRGRGVQVVNLESELCRNFIEPWSKFRNQGIKTLELWAVISLNGFVCNNLKSEDKNIKKLENTYIKYITRNVQYYSYDKLANLENYYHFATGLSFLPFPTEPKIHIHLNLLRYPVLIPTKSENWTEFTFPKNLKLINAQKFGNAVLERYSSEN